jgi:hypothetical protein
MKRRPVVLSILAMFATGANGCAAADPLPELANDTGTETRETWKAVLMTGDDRIEAFDNAREEIAALWETSGLQPEHIVQLSRNDGLVGDDIRPSSIEMLERALVELDVGENDGCAIFMTSHGVPTGFDIRGRGVVTPDRLDQILTRACGQQPTIVLISACFSGVFIEELRAPHRIVMTSAREDRLSFGCAPRFETNFWDGCLIEGFPRVDTWRELHDEVDACISRREEELNEAPSLPQAFFGSEVEAAPIF